MRALLATLILLGTGAASARELTLDEALTLAHQRNERSAIAQEGIRRAEATVQGAWLQFLPSLTVGGNFRLNDREVVVNGRNAQRLTRLSGYGDAELVVFDADTVPVIAEAEQALSAERARAELTRYDLLYQVMAAYLEVAIAQNATRAAQRSVRTAEETHRITDARVRVGSALPLDRLRAKLAVTRAKGLLIRAESVRADTRAFLQFLTAEPEVPEAVEGVEVLDPEQAAGQRPDVRLLEEQLSLEESVAGWDFMMWMPSLTVGGRYELTDDGGFLGLDERGWLEVGLAWELFSRGERFVERTHNRSRLEQARLEVAMAQRRAGYEARAADERLQAARAALQTAQARLEIAREARSQVVTSYEAGRAGALDLLDAEDELQAAEVDLIARQLDLSRAQIDLMRARGIDPKPVAQ